MSLVAEQRQQVEDARKHICPADETGHRFRVDGMCGEEERGQRRSTPESPAAEQLSTEPQHESRGDAMQSDVRQVVAQGPESAEPVVELVAERADGPVRAVGTAVAQVRAPKVVGEQVQPGGRRQDVRVAQDGASGNDKYGTFLGCASWPRRAVMGFRRVTRGRLRRLVSIMDRTVTAFHFTPRGCRCSCPDDVL